MGLYGDVNIGSGKGLVPSGNKSLPEPMLTKFCRHMTSLGQNVLTAWTQDMRTYQLFYPGTYQDDSFMSH